MVPLKSSVVASPRTPTELAEIVDALLARPDTWMTRVRLRADGRWYERLRREPDHDVWVIAWMPGQATGFHDHGASSGAFAIASGTLEEHRAGETAASFQSGEGRAFGPHYAHDVRNVSTAPAISIHAYSPPLSEMTQYDLDGAELVPNGPCEPPDEREVDWRESVAAPPERLAARRIDQVLAAARARLRRLSPLDAHEAVATGGAVLVDIRPAAQRAREGEVPDAIIVERNVLEWRFDPASDARLPVATGHDVQIIVLCSEGYTSSLAAAALQDLGLWRATDVIGGFQAWRAAGYPVARAIESE